jgi:hypothetical protein
MSFIQSAFLVFNDIGLSPGDEVMHKNCLTWEISCHLLIDWEVRFGRMSIFVIKPWLCSCQIACVTSTILMQMQLSVGGVV